MRVPLSWARDYVPLPSFGAIAERLTQAGLEVKRVETIGGSWEKVSVALVTDVQPHPNADRLRLVTVDLGGRTQTVVCGAPNVSVGQKVAFASLGAKLLDGHTGQTATLKAAKIRGVVSEGMVCSEKELGLSEDHDGILVLPGEAPVGKSLAEFMGDEVLDVEVTPNRPDWMSVLGIGHDLAALSSLAFIMPKVEYQESTTDIGSLARVEIADAGLCRRYCATIIQGVKIGPSPRWMQRRLELCGMRPINNVVDVTNYVMLEFGQPLHAFDYSLINEGRIVVRQATQGEAIISLDGVSRELSAGMLVIADPQRAVAVAGVMGGLNSEVSASTTTVLVESANFHEATVRRTAAALNMRSEASMRFEKGLPEGLPMPALLRATQLIIETSGGRAARGVIDVFPNPRPRPAIYLAAGEMQRLLGTEIPLESAKKTLEALGFGCKAASDTGLEVTSPFWRADANLDVDLIEEVARTVGYDRIPTTMMCAPIPPYRPSPELWLKEALAGVLTACGLQEVINYSLTSRDSLARVSTNAGLDGPAPVMIANPMSREFECLRTSLRPRLIANVASNQRFQDRIGLFEIGRVYMGRKDDLPHESEILGVVLSGSSQPVSWRTKERSWDFYDVKGVAEAIFARLGVEASFVPATGPGLREGRCADMLAGSIRLGTLGELHPKVLENFKAEGPVFLLELDLERLLPVVSREFKYNPLPRFPSVSRDTALIIDRSVKYEEVLALVKGLPLVTQVVLFDVYEGGQVPKGKKSIAFRVVYQSPDHTLTDEEVNQVQQQMVDALSANLGALLRA